MEDVRRTLRAVALALAETRGLSAGAVGAWAPELFRPGDAPAPAPDPGALAGGPAAALARAYEGALDAGGRRRRTGAFFTPDYLAAYLVGGALAGDHAPGDTVLDPAMGSGLLLVAAARRLARERPYINVLTRSLYGVDRDPLAVAAARLSLWLEAPDPGALDGDAAAALRAHLRSGHALLGPEAAADGLDWQAAFPAVGAAGGFGALVANPPWGATLPAAERRALRHAFGHLVQGEINIYTLFLAAACRWVRPGGVAALIVPEGWLVNRSEEALRRHLLAAAALDEIAVLRKGAFPAAPDAVPVLVRLRPGAPGGGARVRLFGFTRPRSELPALGWQEEYAVAPSGWRRLPHCLFAVARAPALEQTFCQMEALGGPLAGARLSDGVYKTRLMPLLAPPGAGLGAGWRPALVQAAEVERYRLRWSGRQVAAGDFGRLPGAEQARARAPKLLFHALKKPGAPHRVTCVLDPGEGAEVPGARAPGGLVPTNNFVVLVPPAGGPDPRYLMALFNSRLLGRYYAAHFLQVNIEAFTLGALPLRAVDLTPPPGARAGALAPLVALAGARRWDELLDRLAAAALPAARAGQPAPAVAHDLLAHLAGQMQAQPDPALDRVLDRAVALLYGFAGPEGDTLP